MKILMITFWVTITLNKATSEFLFTAINHHNKHPSIPGSQIYIRKPTNTEHLYFHLDFKTLTLIYNTSLYYSFVTKIAIILGSQQNSSKTGKKV